MGLSKKTPSDTNPDETIIILGQKYRDKVFGIEGIATARYQFLTGCDRVMLEWEKDGEIKGQAFDITQIEDIELKGKDKEKKGGPRPNPTPKS